MAMTVIVMGLWVLSLARVTRLLVADQLTDFLRIWAYHKSKGAETYLTYFLKCAWCMSMWLAFGTAWVIWLHVDWPLYLYPLVALSGSYVVGVFATNLEPDDDIDVEIIND